MADEEDILLLNSGTKDLTSCDFRGADLSGYDLQDRDLTGSHLEKANLTGANLRSANLTRAHVLQADFTGADLSGAILPTPLVLVNFRRAKLQGTKFSGILSKVTLDEADLRGADFSACMINEGCSFAGATYDETTNFEGVKTLRSIARQAPFTQYTFHREGLRRRAEGDQPTAETTEEIATFDSAPSSESEEIPADLPRLAVTATKLVSAPAESLHITQGLASRISDELTALSQQIPNDPAALDAQEKYVSLLEYILEQLSVVADLLRQIAAESPETAKAKASSASVILDGLGQTISGWAKDNGQSSLKYGVNVGLLGLGALFLSSLGISTATAFPVLAVLMCGKDIASVLPGAKKE